MGGDHGPSVVVPAAIEAARRLEDRARVFLLGDEAAIEEQLEPCADRRLRERLTVVHAPENIDMGEAPSAAIRRKKKGPRTMAGPISFGKVRGDQRSISLPSLVRPIRGMTTLTLSERNVTLRAAALGLLPNSERNQLPMRVNMPGRAVLVMDVAGFPLAILRFSAFLPFEPFFAL